MQRRSFTVRWRGVIAASVVLLAACGDDSTTAPASTAPTPPPAAETTVPASAGDLPAAAACAEDGLPAAGALDLATGEVRWVVCSPDEAYRYVIGAADDVVLLSESGASPSGQTVARSAVDGAEWWREPTGRQWAGDLPDGPVAGQGVVVRMSEDREGLVGYDVRTGDVVWQRDEPGEVLGQTDTVAVIVDPEPAPGSPASVVGIDRATGETLWSSDVTFADNSGVVVARGPAAVSGDTIVVPTGGTITALATDSGEVRWTAPALGHPEAADGTVVGVVGTGAGPSVRALDLATGEVRWEAPGRPSYGELMAVGDGIVAVLASDTPEIVAYELETGEERWRVPAAGLGEPQLIVGTTLVLLWEGVLTALSTADGSVLWTANEPFGSPLQNNVGANDSALFVAVNSLPWGD